MPNSRPRMFSDTSARIVTITGPFNSSLLARPGSPGAYSSYSYTVRDVIEVLEGDNLGAQSRPLNPGAVRALNSMLRSRVPESAILRDTSGEL